MHLSKQICAHEKIIGKCQAKNKNKDQKKDAMIKGHCKSTNI